MLKRLFLQIGRATFLACLLFSLNLMGGIVESHTILGTELMLDQAHASHRAVAQSDDTQAQIFVLLASSDPQQLSQVQDFIQSNDGRVTHTFPYQAVIAKLTAGAGQRLAAVPGVLMVLTRPVELSMVDVYGPEARRLVSVWNSLVAPIAEPDAGNLNGAEYSEEHNDAFVAPDLPQIGGLSITNPSTTPDYYQTSEFMAGSVAVGILLVESDGSVDPSSENWTADEKQLVFSEIVAALNWWTGLEPRANFRFVYDDHFTQPLPTGVEPITRTYQEQQYWIKDAMTALGYDSSTSYFALVRDYNNAIRSNFQTDWAFTIFVVDSSADTDNRFSDSFFAYAYLGGPFMVMTYGNNGYGPGNLDAVAAHEIGHIFYALDQYYGTVSCDLRSGYLYVENQNSQYGGCLSNETSIMRGSTFPYTVGAIDEYAAGQIGWRDSDGDNILDPLDTNLPVMIDTLIQESDTVTVSGIAQLVPYPAAHPNRSSLTINTITGVQYRFNGGTWQQAVATDGVFDGVTETYHFTTHPPTPGLYLLEIAAVDSAGNRSDTYATETIIIFDTVDNGLNTVLMPQIDAVAGQSTRLSGVAYNLPGNVVSKVEYRINGGPWQAAVAQDGDFDSDYESFLIILDPLQAGMYFIEAFATDASGYQEIDIASQEISLSDHPVSTVFLPIVIQRM